MTSQVFIFRINWSISAFSICPACSHDVGDQFFINIKTSFNTDTIVGNWGVFRCISVVDYIHFITYSILRNMKTSLFINLNLVHFAFQVNVFYVLLWVQVCILTERGLISFILFFSKILLHCVLALLVKSKKSALITFHYIREDSTKPLISFVLYCNPD